MFLDISNFPKETSSLSPSVVFLYFHSSLKKAVLLSLLFFGTLHLVLCTFPFPPCFSLLSSAVCKASSNNHFAFLLFFPLGWFCLLLPVQYCGPPSTDLQAHGLLDLIPWIYSSPPLSIYRGFDFKSYLAGLAISPAFFSLSLNFAKNIWWSEPQSAPSLVFADYIKCLHLRLQRI